MKIEYDPKLYGKIAQFRVNNVVKVRNRKGYTQTISIQNITKLTWHQLQLLVPNGKDKFSKMVLLYGYYSSPEGASKSTIQGEYLSKDEQSEINKYITIFRENGFTKHYEVNNFINENNMWDEFTTIRSLNDHGIHKEIEGIEPRYFAIICHILSISGEGGSPLDSYKKY